MKIADDQLKMSITFDEYETRLIRAAARMTHALHDLDIESVKRRDYRWVIRWAVIAFCRGLIQRGKINFPVSADLRPEDPIEQAERLANKIPAAGICVNQNSRWN